MSRQSLKKIYEHLDQSSIAQVIDQELAKLDQKQLELVSANYEQASIHLDSTSKKNLLMLDLLDKVDRSKEPKEPKEKRLKYVGKYRVLRQLGKGTFGKVLLAIDDSTMEKVAIKVINRSKIQTSRQRISIQREIKIIKLLHHPNIVSIHKVMETYDTVFIIMEHASGGELFEHIIKHGLLSEEESRKLFRQALSAVDYCHRNSIIHRDLKPENLLLDQDNNVKLIDFGFGNTYSRDSLLDTFCGSPFYAAPEMVQGVKYFGPEVDIWSLGVVLFTMISGRLPFDGKDMTQLYERICSGKYAEPEQANGQVADLIRIMLIVDPKKRATMEQIKNHPWVNFGYFEKISNFVPVRPLTVPNPNEESLSELVSYGFNVEECRSLLRRSTGMNPITSLYHLVDEWRIRNNEDKLRSISQSSVPNADIDVALSNISITKPSIKQEAKLDQVPIRGFFTISASSKQHQTKICMELESALFSYGIDYQKEDIEKYSCYDQMNKIHFEVYLIKEVMKTLIQMKRIKGNIWTHNNVCRKVLLHMNI